MFFLEKQGGQGVAEYAWLLGLVALLLIVLVTVLGQEVLALYGWIIDQLPFV